MELQKGRPENTDNRLDKEIRVYDFLDKLGVQHQRIDHEVAMTMEACGEIDRALGDNTTICKNLFLCNRQETDFYLLLSLVINRLRQKISLRRSIPPDYLLPNWNIWRNILISPLDPSAYWD